MKSNRQSTEDLTNEVVASIQSEIALPNKEELKAKEYPSIARKGVIDTDIKTTSTKRILKFTNLASASTKIISSRFIKIAKKIDDNHEKIATRAEDVSMTTGVIAGVATAGAALAAPTGLTAIGVFLGITSAPLIVTASPVLAIIATAAGTISGGTYFYSKWKNHRKKTNKLQE